MYMMYCLYLVRSLLRPRAMNVFSYRNNRTSVYVCGSRSKPQCTGVINYDRRPTSRTAAGANFRRLTIIEKNYFSDCFICVVL